MHDLASSIAAATLLIWIAVAVVCIMFVSVMWIGRMMRRRRWRKTLDRGLRFGG